jgi:dolichyl-phosphate mannosyltransferase polypeptide 2 regulatory subunit
MSFSDKSLGFLLLSTAVIIFLYYTVWVLVLPFADKQHPINSYFPPQYYAIALPATVLVVAVVMVSLFIGVVLIRENSKKKL